VYPRVRGLLHGLANHCAWSELWCKESSVHFNHNDNVGAACLHWASELLGYVFCEGQTYSIRQIQQWNYHFKLHYSTLQMPTNTLSSAVETRLDYITASNLKSTDRWCCQGLIRWLAHYLSVNLSNKLLLGRTIPYFKPLTQLIDIVWRISYQFQSVY